jgi:hypothetical protein
MRVIGWLAIAVGLHATSAFSQQKLAGTIYVNRDVQPGYTLFTSLNTKNTYLVDNCGNLIKSWQSQYTSGSSAYLMKNGNMLRATNLSNTSINRAGGGGGFEIMDWNSNMVWSAQYNTPLVRPHHDIIPMDNGNILVLAWQVRTRDEALAAGRNPNLIPDGVVWPEEIVELKPVLPNSFEIVWKWNLWDHLVQDYDPTKNNYGVVGDHPELVDINYVNAGGAKDWIHANAIDYNPELDQIIICSLVFDEFWIIDHSTTTAQASTHSGGKSNRGGDLLYRWGNPKTYRQGTEFDQVLQGPHHAHWIKKGLPLAGSIMIFNNNAGTDYSAVEIINPPVTSTGTYQLQNGRYGPSVPNKTVTANPPKNLYSVNMSGAEMQPNGNILICPSQQGRFVELTPELDTAWIYKSPITATGIAGVDFIPTNSNFKSDPSFRAMKYEPVHPALTGKDLAAGDPIEGGDAECVLTVGVLVREESTVRVYPNPTSDFVCAESVNPDTVLDVQITDLNGQKLLSERGRGSVQINTKSLPDGFFIVRVNKQSVKIVKKGTRD